MRLKNEVDEITSLTKDEVLSWVAKEIDKLKRKFVIDQKYEAAADVRQLESQLQEKIKKHMTLKVNSTINRNGLNYSGYTVSLIDNNITLKELIDLTNSTVNIQNNDYLLLGVGYDKTITPPTTALIKLKIL